MGYIGEIKERVKVNATLKLGKETYVSHFAYQATQHYIYKFEDEAGNILVWKTTSYQPMYPGALVELSGTVKAHSEYNGEEQTELSRCKVKVIQDGEKPLTKEEREEIKAAAQLATLQEGDIVYRVTYQQYKKHYADCETVAGSFQMRHETAYGVPTIQVIVRAGRMKASGSRGEHYKYFHFITADGKEDTRYFRAICEENAWKQLKREKDYKDRDISIFQCYEVD